MFLHARSEQLYWHLLVCTRLTSDPCIYTGQAMLTRYFNQRLTGLIWKAAQYWKELLTDTAAQSIQLPPTRLQDERIKLLCHRPLTMLHRR